MSSRTDVRTAMSSFEPSCPYRRWLTFRCVGWHVCSVWLMYRAHDVNYVYRSVTPHNTMHRISSYKTHWFKVTPLQTFECSILYVNYQLIFLQSVQVLREIASIISQIPTWHLLILFIFYNSKKNNNNIIKTENLTLEKFIYFKWMIRLSK